MRRPRRLPAFLLALLARPPRLMLAAICASLILWLLLQHPIHSLSPTSPLPAPPAAAAAEVAPAALSDLTGVHLHISEILVQPAAVSNSNGEWIELHNDGSSVANLRHWTLQVGDARHVIAADVRIAPGAYGVLARDHDPLSNGGVSVQYQYAGLPLPDSGTLLLLTPDEQVMDTVTWDHTSPVVEGRSLARADATQPNAWWLAWSPWPGSHGDWGSPGAPWQPPPAPTPAPTLLITEVMPDPAAVADDAGEWVEIYNPGAAAVNLAHWWLASGNQRTQLQGDIWLAAGAYGVLARNTDSARNGGVQALGGYATLQLTNDAASVSLLAPDQSEVAHVAWGVAQGLPVQAGRSLERLDTGAWRSAVLPWQGSMGDWGSPGSAAPPAPPTALPTAVATPSPVATATPEPTPLPAAWQWLEGESPLLLDEVRYRGESEEFVVIVNRSHGDVALAGWLLGDASRPGANEGMIHLPESAVLPAGGVFILARDAHVFQQQWGGWPNLQLTQNDAPVPVAVSERALGAGSFSLNDQGDTLLLLTPDLRVADGVNWGEDGENHLAASFQGTLRAESGQSLQRLPDSPPAHTSDQRYHWVSAPPAPLVRVQSPPFAPRTRATVALADGLHAYLGALGAQSTFTHHTNAPPRWVLAQATTQQLDFIALADPRPHASLAAPPSVTVLPAWQWHGTDGEQAILYDHMVDNFADRWALLPWIAMRGPVVQWVEGASPVLTGVSSVAARGQTLDAVVGFMRRQWQATGIPLLPAGGVQPGAVSAFYTGLAAEDARPNALLDALRQQRGWLTTDPGLHLALSAQSDAGRVWMGSATHATNALPLRIDVGSARGAELLVRLWQDGTLLHEQIVNTGSAPPVWNILAAPGTWLYATAQDASGAFALTAPIHIRASEQGMLRLSEVLPAPASDWNGDGVVSDMDEFIELYNPGAQPVALDGWMVQDLSEAQDEGAPFTFKSGQVVAGYDYYVLWRSESGTVLNNGAEALFLRSPGGGMADQVAWTEGFAEDRTLALLDDAWHVNQPPTPGRANGPATAASTAIQPYAAPALPPSSIAPVESASAPSSAPEMIAAPVALAEVQVAEVNSAAVAAAPIDALSVVPAAPAAITNAPLLRAQENGMVTLRAVVVVPPGLINNAIYVAQMDGSGAAGEGIRLYSPAGYFPALAEGDEIEVSGVLSEFSGEREVRLDGDARLAVVQSGAALAPVPLRASAIGEATEGRLVTIEGAVAQVTDDSLYLVDLLQPTSNPVRVIVLRSLDWQPPAANPGEVWRATGVVSQLNFARANLQTWMLIVRYPSDLERLHPGDYAID